MSSRHATPKALEQARIASELLQQLRECKRQRALLEARIRELEAKD